MGSIIIHMNLALNIFLPVLADATSLPDSPPISQAVLRGLLVGSVWIFVLAILIGLVVKHFIGDLWARKDSQPFVDDSGAHH